MAVQGFCICGCGNRTRKRDGTGEFDHRAKRRAGPSSRRQRLGGRLAWGQKPTHRLRKKVTITVKPALAGAANDAPEQPALAGIARNALAVPAAVPPTSSALEDWLVNLRSGAAEESLGKDSSYMWLAVAMGFACQAQIQALFVDFSSKAQHHEFLIALALFASKMESDHSSMHTNFRKRLLLSVTDIAVFKEADRRLAMVCARLCHLEDQEAAF